jgi:hypothetical protein
MKAGVPRTFPTRCLLKSECPRQDFYNILTGQSPHPLDQGHTGLGSILNFPTLSSVTMGRAHDPSEFASSFINER